MEKVKQWIKDHARPLEKSLYLFYFEDGTKDKAIKELKAFQNKDGGFGHGLEPDFRNPNSNPIDSWKAARIVDGLNVKKENPMIQSLIKYFINTEHKENWIFYFRIPSNNDYPRAPWWHYTNKNKIEDYNPTASILGFLYKYMDEDHPKYKEIEDALDNAINYLINNDIKNMHELTCFNELYEYICEGIDCTIIHKRLLELNTLAIETDSHKWFTSYSAKPTQVFVSMHSPGAIEMIELVHKEFTLSLEHRNEDGVFDITWDWQQYPTEFEKAKREWMGIIALKTLRVAKEYKYATEE
ncbi:MAG: hypothetical protein PF513_01415 [Tenericutes bacterium]|jgi:hypothetical protein|nr:hypothetical protein [Mycoplasmatota bacterium]